ncbi:macro domain-containing protein [Salisaeta longa]|uniref:macro domain-containing protein n=1 Tax=Salisaeta longa TaxID=503170 RepID=UPI0003B7146F|nr:macro domain-containing protein [Salisaeta longa]
MTHTTHDVTIDVRTGDIAHQADVTAVVNAANAQLRSGGGVAGALHRAAGPGLAEEAAPLAPLAPGEAVVTSGHNLPNDVVIHALGPVYGRDTPSDELLATAYRNVLACAEGEGIARLATPALSTGAFGYPMEDAARVALQAVLDEAPTLDVVTYVRFVLYDDRALRIHERALKTLIDV